MLSTTTIALSTSIPTASTSEKSTIMLSVIPISWTTTKVSSIESGIAAPTKSALRRPRVKNSTTTTSTTPESTLFSRSATIMRISFDMSAMKATSTPAGQPARRRATSSLIRSVTAMMLAPERFWTESATDSRPSIREYDWRSLRP